ncbi:Rib/alpha-like domain-containing protein, partial [Peptoniphilus harei]|uniref:Rib/alpha-like domain-containing protein n=1 Tax=Peptoniphilus harei TaxID=54005 RepID=UPI0029031A1F
TPQVKKIEVNKDEDVTLEKLKTGIVNLPEDIKDIEIVGNVDTSEVGEGKTVLKLIFSDTSNKEVEIPVKVINVIDAALITPVPEIKESDIITEEVPYNGAINLLDNIENLPDGAEIEDISDTISTKISRTYTGKVKVIFKDGSSRIVVIPVEVSEALADSYTPQVKKIEVNKDEDVTLEKLKSGIVNLPKNLDKIEIKTYPDTSKVGEGKATLKLIFTDTSSKEVVIPVKVINIIDAGIVTPVPEIKVEDIIKEEVPYNGQINILDNIKNLPDGAKVEDISDPIDTKRPGTYTGKVKVIFKDGSSRIVEIPIEVLEALADSYTPQVKKIEVNKDEDVTLEKLKTGIVNIPKNLDKIEIKTYPDTSEVVEGKATLKLIFTDTSSKEVVIPVKVINIIDAGIVTPIPEIKAEDIIKEEVPYNGEINLLDNIENLPDGAEVQDISDLIDTKIPGTYTGKIKITFKDGSSRIVEIPIEVLEALASSYTPGIKTIEVNKDKDVTLEKLKSGITNLPENIKEIEITTPPDTSKVEKGKATLKLIFTDTSSKEVEIPVRVIEKISGGAITPIPTINNEDIIKEEVPYHGQINLLDNIKNLPDGAKVEDISETIDTKTPGTYTGKVKVIFKDGSSRIVEVPVEVLTTMAEKFPV